MSPDQASKILAEYLLGGRPQEDLHQAWEIVRGDETSRPRLASALGHGEEVVSACDLFASRVAEFAEMTAAQRRLEGPELLDHLAHCPACRQRFWRVTSLWEEARRPGGEGTRILAEPLRLAVLPGGFLGDRGIGPPELPSQPLAMAAGPSAAEEHEEEGGPPPTSRKEWELADEESGLSFHWTVMGLPSGEVEVRLGVMAPHGRSEPEVWVEVYHAEQDRLYRSADLAGLRAQPLRLRPGGWRVRMEITAGGPAFSREVSFILQ